MSAISSAQASPAMSVQDYSNTQNPSQNDTTVIEDGNKGSATSSDSGSGILSFKEASSLLKQQETASFWGVEGAWIEDFIKKEGKLTKIKPFFDGHEFSPTDQAGSQMPDTEQSFAQQVDHGFVEFAEEVDKNDLEATIVKGQKDAAKLIQETAGFNIGASQLRFLVTIVKGLVKDIGELIKPQ